MPFVTIHEGSNSVYLDKQGQSGRFNKSHTGPAGHTCRGFRLNTPDCPKAVGSVPEKALWEMFMARSAGKKLVPLAAAPDTLLGRGPLQA
jgi:hypothetical protein